MARPATPRIFPMLPKLVDPRRLAEQRVTYQEKIAVSMMPRVAEVVESASADFEVDLGFSRDEQHRVRVSGKIAGAVVLICQRCMQPVEVQLQQAIELQVVWTDEQSKAVAKDLDPWQINESANLHELIEDEILLAFPVVAMHRPGDCEAPKIAGSNQVSASQESVEQGLVEQQLAQQPTQQSIDRQRPFENLKDLMKPSDKK